MMTGGKMTNEVLAGPSSAELGSGVKIRKERKIV